MKIKHRTKEPSWLNKTIKEAAQKGTCLGKIKVQGLEIDFWASEPSLYSWLLEYLHPLPLDTFTAKKKLSFKLGSFVADEVFQEAIRFIDSGAIDILRVNTGRRKIERLIFSSKMIVDCDRSQGMLFVTDLKQNTVTMVFSNRTQWKALEVGRCARELINGYLEDQGWQAFHSGAMQTENGTFIIIGDAGAGKTSIILSLISTGARFISNERSYIKVIDGEVHTLLSPLPIAIGMGTAIQYPEIVKYVRQPEFCLYPPRRMNLHRIRNTPEHKWPSLEDKVQLLPSEIISAFDAPEGLAGDKVCGVVVPYLTKRNRGAEKLPPDITRKIINNNYFTRDKYDVYPAWMPFPFSLPTAEKRNSIIDAMCKLPTIRFNYFASRDRQNEMQRYPEMIEKALKMKR